MLENPIVRTLFLFLGCYFLLNFLGMLGWPFPALAVTVSAVVAVTAWLYYTDYPRLQALYAQPLAKPVITLICEKVLNVQAPVGANPEAKKHAEPVRRQADAQQAPGQQVPAEETLCTDTEAGKEDQGALLLRTADDFARAGDELVDVVRGADENISRLLNSVRTNVDVRSLSQREAIQPPLGIFLCVGPAGLGKQHLATEFARRAYAAPSLTLIDVADTEDPAGDMLDAVKQNPHQTLVLLDIDRASEELLKDLSTIAEKGALRDGKATVSFRHSFVFLCADRPVEECQRLRSLCTGPSGVTAMIRVISEDTAFDARLASVIDEMLFFELPSPEEQAEVVLLRMQSECEKYGQELGFVEPEVILREVRCVARTRSFELTPGRIARRLKPAILAAQKAGGAVEVRDSDEDAFDLEPVASAAAADRDEQDALARHLGEVEREAGLHS